MAKISNKTTIKMIWHDVNKRKPLAYKTGHWDGKMSDKVLVYTKTRDYYIAVMYHVIMDGAESFDFYDDRDFEIQYVTHWAEIDSPF